MAKQVNVRTDKDHREAMDAMIASEEADSYAEAMRQTSRTELARRGYMNGHNGQTRLRATITEMAKLFLYAGVALLGVTWFYPVELRVVAMGPIISGLFLIGVDRALEQYEPALSQRLKRILGGEPA